MDLLFPACVAVLEDAMMPLHYRDITSRALERLRHTAPCAAAQADEAKNAENVREKLLGATRLGTFYLGKPSCLGAMQRWFRLPQLSLLHQDTVAIPGHAQAGADGGFEALMRSPFMETKYRTALPHRRYKACAQGLVLQAHVVQWFTTHYARLVRPPLNEGRWNLPCNHDFQLVLPTRTFLVDITGPDLHGLYIHAPKKAQADLHLLCRIVGRDCRFEGVIRGQDFTMMVIPETSLSPVNFCVWLHCLQRGLDYPLLTQHAIAATQ